MSRVRPNEPWPNEECCPRNEAGIKGRGKWLHLTVSVWCNYLSLPLKQVSRTGTNNYISQYLWDVIICSCPWYLILTQYYSNHNTKVHRYFATDDTRKILGQWGTWWSLPGARHVIIDNKRIKALVRKLLKGSRKLLYLPNSVWFSSSGRIARGRFSKDRDTIWVYV